MGDHAESAARQFAKLGMKPKIAPVIEGPECPRQLVYLWNYFHEISMGLASNGMGPPLVTWESLVAWSRFSRVALMGWEARALVDLGYKRAIVQSEDVRGADRRR